MLVEGTDDLVSANRAIVGVAVSNEGSDPAGLSAPMREQVEKRTEGKVQARLLSGGYVRFSHPPGREGHVLKFRVAHPALTHLDLTPAHKVS